MNPVNSRNSGCDPISSTCVVWQGPDISCLDLCKGDSVTDVVYKAALKLCELNAILDINSFDLTCFNLAECAPKDFPELINLLIEKICELQEVETTVISESETCPDCEVAICSEFYYNNPSGDQMTSMQLVDYVKAIGNKVCQLITQNVSQSQSILDLDNRVTELENTPAPVLELPLVEPKSTETAESRPLNRAVEDIDAVLADVIAAGGNKEALFKTVQTAPSGLNQADQLRGVGKMKDLPDWNSAPTNQAESIQNLWLVVNDLRSQVVFMKHNCCNDTCSAVDVFFSGTIPSSGVLRLEFGGSVPNNFIDGKLGSSITVIDALGVTQTFNAIALRSLYLDPMQPLLLNLLGINTATDLAVKLTYRFIDPTTGSTCENLISLVVLGTDTCPNLTLVSGYNDVSLSFTWSGTTPRLMTVELWNDAQDTLLQSKSLNVISSSPSTSFVGLSEGVTYGVRLIIDGGSCEFEEFTTLEYPCIAATLNAPTINYSSPEGATTGDTILGWQVEYDSYHP